MSQEEEIFKQQLDELLAARSFQFEEAAWQDMSSLLDAKKRKRRLLYFWWIGLLGGLIGIATWLALPNTQPTEMAKTKPTMVAASEPAALKSAPEAITAAPAVQVTTAKPKLNEATPLTTESPNKVVTPSAPTAEVPVKSAPVAAPTKIKTAPTPAALPPLNVVPELVLSNSAPPLKTQSPVSVVKNETITPADQAPETPATKTQAPIESQVPAVAAVPTVNQQTPQTVQEPVAAAPTTSAQPITSMTETAETAVVPSPSVEPSPSPSITTMAAAPLKPDTDYVKRKVPDIRLELGGTLLAGWSDANGRDGRGINPLAGIVYNLPIGKEIKIGLGLQYTMVSHLKYSEYTATVTRLDLGRNTKATVFTPTRIHYAMLPFKVHFKLDDKQSAGIGCNLAVVLTVDDKVKEYQETSVGVYDVKNYKVKGYNEGFTSWDSQITFFYQRKFAPHLWLNAELMYGLTDVKNGVVFKSFNKERNSGLKISVLYSLFSK